jgi:cobalt/nickel transport system permease protein
MGSGHIHAAPLSGSWLGRLDVRARLLAFLPALVLLNLVGRGELLPVALVGGLFLALAVSCGHGALTVLLRGFFLLPFVLFVVVTLPFAADGEVLASVDLGVLQLSATREGMILAADAAVRGGASILAVLILSGTTEPPRLFEGLSSLGLPRAFVLVLSMVYRYLFEIAGELARVRRAAAARAFRMTSVRAVPRLGTMAGAVLVRSIERSERVNRAMRARGFDGEVRTIGRERFGLPELAFLAAFHGGLAALLLGV